MHTVYTTDTISWAAVADSPHAVAAASDVIVLCVPGSPQVEQVVSSPVDARVLRVLARPGAQALVTMLAPEALENHGQVPL